MVELLNSRKANYAAWAKEQGFDAIMITARMRGNDAEYLLPSVPGKDCAGLASRRDALVICATGEGFLFTAWPEYIDEYCNPYTKDAYTIVLAKENPGEVIGQTLTKCGVKTLGFSPEEMSASLYIAVSDIPGVTLKAWDCEETMRARRHHDAEEIAIMTKGQRIAEEAWLELIQTIRPGMTEKEVQNRLVSGMIARGASSYSCHIVSAGKHTGNVHWGSDNTPLQKGDLIMFDFGCVYEGYCTDMTRTVALCSYTPEQKRIYDIVLEAQYACIDKMAVGVPAKDIHNEAVRVFKKYGLDEHFTHGLGHNVGTIIHEYPYADPESEDILEVGDMITVEPGLYFENEFGVRIEDMVWLGPDGKVNLTAAPKDELMIIG